MYYTTGFLEERISKRAYSCGAELEASLQKVDSLLIILVFLYNEICTYILIYLYVYIYINI